RRGKRVARASLPARAEAGVRPKGYGYMPVLPGIKWACADSLRDVRILPFPARLAVLAVGDDVEVGAALAGDLEDELVAPGVDQVVGGVDVRALPGVFRDVAGLLEENVDGGSSRDLPEIRHQDLHLVGEHGRVALGGAALGLTDAADQARRDERRQHADDDDDD